MDSDPPPQFLFSGNHDQEKVETNQCEGKTGPVALKGAPLSLSSGPGM